MEYRPRVSNGATATSALNGQPPEGTSGDGKAGHIMALRMAGNGGIVSRGEEWFAAIALAAVIILPIAYIMLFGELPV